MPGEDDLELKLKASLADAVSAVAARIEARLEAMERRLDDVGEAGERSGDKVDAGAEKASKGLGRQEEAAKRTGKATEELGEKASKAGRKAGDSATGWEKLAKKWDRNAKAAGGFSRILTTLKIVAVVTALFALAGALSAVAAAAVMAVGALGSLVPAFAALGPVALASVLGMKAWKLGAKEAAPKIEALGKKFDGLGKAVLKGGMGEGLDYLTRKIGPFVKVTERGFGLIGGSLGRAQHTLADFLNESYRLNEMNAVFASSSRIIDKLVPGVIGFTGGLLHGLVAAMPAAERVSRSLGEMGMKFDTWMRRQLESGRATEVINASLDRLAQTGRSLGNYLVGLFNIFRIGAQSAQGLGDATERASQRFRYWTQSAEGQNKIRDYFERAKPAIVEMGLLVRDIFKMFLNLGASEGLAPLLQQIRTEFLPALGDLLGNFVGPGGLGPALVTIATALARFFAAVDPTALIVLIEGFAALLNVVAWIAQNVPGAGFVISTLVTALLLLGPAFKIAAMGATMFSRAGIVLGWLGIAAAGTGKLTLAQRALHAVLGPAGTLFTRAAAGVRMFTLAMLAGSAAAANGGMMAKTGAAAARFGTFLRVGLVSVIFPQVAAGARIMWAAMLGPIGWIILAVVAVIAILVTLWNTCAWFRDAVAAMWEFIKNVGLYCWRAIVEEVKIAWAIISFVIQAAMFIIVGIITLLALTLQGIWWLIATAAVWVWQSMILPVIQFVAMLATAAWAPVGAFFGWLWGMISGGASWCFNGISAVAGAVAGAVVGKWNSVIGVVKGAYNALARAWNSIPSISVPAWVPGIGGNAFSLPKLPTLWHGGRIEYQAAIVGEHGPEPLIGPHGSFEGLLGTRGPEIATNLPRGGYVVPNLSTLTRTPGLLKSLPTGVANAVANAVPGYADVLRPSGVPAPPPPSTHSNDRELVSAVRALAAATDRRPPPISASGPDTEDQVLRALRKWQREERLRGRHRYGD